MPNQPVPVILDKGLDTVVHPVLAESGTLIDCLNYEMVSNAGYRRIDGYEAYDGWIAGDIADYYRVDVNITDLGIVPALTLGRNLSLVDTVPLATEKSLGVILNFTSTGANTGTITYAPANKDAPIILNGTAMDIELNSTSRMTATSNATKGSVTDSAATFVANMRTYSSALRALVVPMTTPVAGLHWFRNTLIAARDCYTFTYNDSDSTSRNFVQVGSILAYDTDVYRVITRSVSGTLMTLALERIANQTSNSSIRVLSQNLGPVLHTVVTSSNISLTTVPNDQAYLISLNTPEIWNERGRVLLKRSIHINFSGGVALAESNFVPGGVITIGVAGPGTDYIAAVIKWVEVTSGSFGAGTAAGWMEVVIDPGLTSGSINTPTTSMDILVSGITKLADIDAITWSTIPGTKKMQSAETRYQWITSNFFGQSDTTEMYGATGASRGFWANSYRTPTTKDVPPGVSAVETMQHAWGNIMTDRIATARDIPKYVAYHGGSLAFAIASSVIRSVGGTPYSFNGVLGATETACGDDITGLLEAQNDSLIVLCRRSVRRLTGYTTADLSLRTVGGAGCFDYTACTVGGTPVFAGPAGITTLEQSEQYGDFKGNRITEAVTNTLVPKLITDWSDSEPGGTVMALIVRNKNQYRLWLKTGEVYSVCFTSDGPKVMKSNYGAGNDVRVPFAWTSQLADSGKEHVFVTWDDIMASKNVAVTGVLGTVPNPRHIFEMDRGWGFNGLTFKHYFDVTYLFGQSQAIQITGIRLHGWGYGLATLDIKSSGIEDDYEQAFHSQIQDISMPRALEAFTMNMRPVTSIVDQANWGLGIKLRVNGTTAENLTPTEPSHVAQVLVLQVNPTGAKDN